MSIPGVVPITASAILAFAPPLESFKRGRDFSPWFGLVPRQHSTGGKSRLGKVSKMGQRDIRRLLIIGAMAVARSAVRRAGGLVAGSDAGAQASDAGRGGAGESNGAHRMGADDERPSLQRTGAGRLSSRQTDYPRT